MSKYAKLVATIQSAILSGEYEPGSRLPTLTELCELYNVSNTTVKKAMDELEHLGLVARRRGSGVYVKSTAALGDARKDNWSASGQMSGLTAEYASSSKRVESVVNEFEVVHPSPRVAKALNMDEGEFVYYICRTRVADGMPVNVEYTYMPLSLIPGLVEKHLYGSIYQYIEGDLGLKIGSAHRVLCATTPTKNEIEWLGASSSDPLLEVRQVGYLDDGRPFELSTTHHTKDYEFFVVSTH